MKGLRALTGRSETSLSARAREVRRILDENSICEDSICEDSAHSGTDDLHTVREQKLVRDGRNAPSARGARGASPHRNRVFWGVLKASWDVSESSEVILDLRTSQKIPRTL